MRTTPQDAADVTRRTTGSIIVNNQGDGCTLTVTRTGTGQHYEVRQPRSGGCAPDLWVRDNFVVQEGFDSPGGRVVSLDPPSDRGGMATLECRSVCNSQASREVHPLVSTHPLPGWSGTGSPTGKHSGGVLSPEKHDFR